MAALSCRVGSAAEAAVTEEAVAEVVACGVVGLLLGLLGVLSTLRTRGADVVAPWEASVLACLLALVSASAAARAQLHTGYGNRSGLLVCLLWLDT